MGPQEYTALFRALADDRTVLLYKGAFPDAHSARLLTIAEQALGHGVDRRSARRVSARLAFVLVEAYQNILRHGPAGGEGGVLLMRCSDDRVSVMSRNPAESDVVPGLEAALGQLSMLGADQLKTRFLQGLRSQARTARGGAGLGLIEIVRRSTGGVRYRTDPLPDGGMLFSLEAQLAEAAPPSWEQPVQEALAITHDRTALLVYKGAFSAAAQNELARMAADEPRGADGKVLRQAAVLAALEVAETLPDGAYDRCVAWSAGKDGLVSVAVGAWMEHCDADRFGAYAAGLESAAVASARHREFALRRTLPDHPAEQALAGLLRLAVAPAHRPGAQPRSQVTRIGDRSLLVVAVTL